MAGRLPNPLGPAPPVNDIQVNLKKAVYQLINEQETFFSNALANLLISKLKEGSSRQCVSILGPQNSGKSTLLNHVFDTSFEVLQEGVGFGQTTKGIWASNSQDILILDVAGTDNIKAGDEGEVFEKKLLLFSLVVSSVIIFNINQGSITHYQASCLKLFQEILEYRLTIFPQNEDKKVLLFCIKDYDGRSPRDTLIGQLKDSIDLIWTNIKKKPEFAAYSSRSLEDLFSLKFEVVFHPLINDKQNFNQDMNRIKKSFPNYLNLGEAPKLTSSGGNVLVSDPLYSAPSAPYLSFVKGIWKTINQSPLITSEDIEAVRGCTFHFESLFKEFTTELETLMKNVGDPLKTVSFQQSFNGLIAVKTSSYDASCSQYPGSLRDRIRKSLVKSMMLQFLTELAREEIKSRVTKGLQDPNAYFWDNIRADRNTVKNVVTDNFRCFVEPQLISDPDLKVSIKKRFEDYVDNYFKELVIVFTSNVCFIFGSRFDQWSWFDFFTFGLFANVEDKYTKSLKYAKDLIDKLSRYQMNPGQTIEVIPPASVAILKENLEAHADARKQESLGKRRKKRMIAGGFAAGGTAVVVAGGVAVVTMPLILNALVLDGFNWEFICTSVSYAKTIIVKGVWNHREEILSFIMFLFQKWYPKGSPSPRQP